MKSRGLVIPDSVKEILEFNEKPWSVDPNGYFVKMMAHYTIHLSRRNHL